MLVEFTKSCKQGLHTFNLKKHKPRPMSYKLQAKPMLWALRCKLRAGRNESRAYRHKIRAMRFKIAPPQADDSTVRYLDWNMTAQCRSVLYIGRIICPADYQRLALASDCLVIQSSAGTGFLLTGEAGSIASVSASPGREPLPPQGSKQLTHWARESVYWSEAAGASTGLSP
jgi:hypothetical protein